ncbi:hypothetical protein [Microvirga sp. 17 mud 1-3]|uniref:hypothetical protein n=1 Tax=Microvirga sp. 17 mud 1-3 TaxID=2082949 RepID=UPI0013A59CC3|nr:hypothetical protein [Microvirga sp. 17 mud 1-3]
MTSQPSLPSQGMSEGAAFAQKAATLIVKAGLSSIPLAALVFDIGQMAVELANARPQNRFLNDVGERLSRLEADAAVKASSDPLHANAANAAMRALLTETNENIAAALARAVVELRKRDLSHYQKSECARIFASLNEPFLHGLQTSSRYSHGQLTEAESSLMDPNADEREQLGLLLKESMQVTSWPSILDQLMWLGLLEDVIDAGVIGEPDYAVTVRSPTKLGKLILELCYEDQSRPLLGRFKQEI